jgi:hypothetical protein
MNANHTGCYVLGFPHTIGASVFQPHISFSLYTMAIAAEMDKRAKSAHFFGAV